MRPRRNVPVQFNSASMSDVAFLLLIFFLVTTIFAFERGIPLVLPADTPPKRVRNVLTIQAHPNGTITIDDRIVPLCELCADVEKRLASNDKLIVSIESHPDSEYGLMVDILDELRLANARRISLREMRVASR